MSLQREREREKEITEGGNIIHIMLGSSPCLFSPPPRTITTTTTRKNIKIGLVSIPSQLQTTHT